MDKAVSTCCVLLLQLCNKPERETDRQTVRQRERQRDRQTDRLLVGWLLNAPATS